MFISNSSIPYSECFKISKDVMNEKRYSLNDVIKLVRFTRNIERALFGETRNLPESGNLDQKDVYKWDTDRAITTQNIKNAVNILRGRGFTNVTIREIVDEIKIHNPKPFAGRKMVNCRHDVTSRFFTRDKQFLLGDYKATFDYKNQLYRIEI